MTATLLPNAKQQFLDDEGNPLVDGLVYFYVPSSSTPKNTWQDAAQSTLNTNPVQLDSAGEALIYGVGAYRQVVYDSLGNLIWDAVTSGNIPFTTCTTAGDMIYFDGTSYQRLAAGTSGYFLRANGAGVAPSWQANSASSCLVYKTSAQSIPDNVATAISWNTEQYDDLAFWNSGDPTKFTIPSGVSRIRVSFCATIDNTAGEAGVWRAAVRKNGVYTYAGQPASQILTNAGTTGHLTLTSTSGALEVTAGDYFEVYITQDSSGAHDVVGTAASFYSCWFSIWTA